MLTACNKTCNVRHIYHKICADFLSNSRELFKVNCSGICARTRNDHLGLMLLCKCKYIVVIQSAGFLIKSVRYEVEVFARNVHGRTVCKVSAVSKAHTHYRIAGIQQCKINRRVSLCAGVSLYIRILCSEQLAGTFNSDILNYINILASAVITLAGVSLSILVRKNASHSRHNSRRNDILTCNKLKISFLTGKLLVHCVSNIGIYSLEKADRVN